MHVVETIAACRQARAGFAMLGFVPTMGYLHEGHLRLVRRAMVECGAVAVSIFVNPTQFGPHEDFERYPRNRERDLHLLEAEGTTLVFMPGVDELYPAGYRTFVSVEDLTKRLEGAARPGHFRGVTTIVCKLLNIVQPTRAYFGQKDAQQTVVVRQMVRDLNMPTEIVVAETAREPDGLAMSSRNAYLSPQERQAATVLCRALRTAQRRYHAGIRDGEALREAMRQVLGLEPLAQTEYVSAAHPETLQEREWVDHHGVLLSLAVRIGSTRLIDNILIEGDE
jgi:pantoate--beta-alanine ligase